MRARGIQAGDVVQVIRDCCGDYLGLVYTVGVIDFVSDARPLQCPTCGSCFSPTAAAWNADASAWGLVRVAPVAWLRRFEPPAEPLSKIDELYRADPLPQTVVVARGALWTPEEWSSFLRRIEREWPA